MASPTPGQLPPSIRRRNLYKRRKYSDYWQKLLEEARDAGEIDPGLDLSLARMFLLGGLNWTVDWFDPKKRPLEDFVEEVCRIFFHGAESAASPRLAKRSAQA